MLSRPDGAVLAGRPALEAGTLDPAAALLRTRPHLAASTGGRRSSLTQWPRPDDRGDVATALIAKVIRAEAGRRGTLPSSVVLLHPASWSAPALEALRQAGLAALGHPLHLARRSSTCSTAAAAAHRLGGQGRLLVVDVGGAATELAVVDRGGDGTGSVTAMRSVSVGAEVLDDALAQLILDRSPPHLAARVRFGGDLEAHRAWYRLRTQRPGRQGGARRTGHRRVRDWPVLPPENPVPGVVSADARRPRRHARAGSRGDRPGISALVGACSGPARRCSSAAD